MPDDPKKGWREIPIGGLIPTAGNSATYETGSWRAIRPVWHEEKCIQCLLCWIYCPDASIQVADGKVVGIDLAHCKGCGICAHECPPRASAITMVDEAKSVREEKK